MHLLNKITQIFKKICYSTSCKDERKIIKMNKALDVARYIINTSNDKGYDITNLRLQKILYFVQMEFVIRGKVCFYDKMEAWDYGPVVPSVYKRFKYNGASNIDKIEYCYDDSEGLWNLKRTPYSDEVLPKEDREIIDTVIEECYKFNTSALVRISHSQSPWIEAHEQINNEITVESIKKFISDNQ